MAYLFANKLDTFFDDNAVRLASGWVYIYNSGSGVAANSYSNSAMTNLNTNPVMLNAAGRPNTNIYLGNGAYRIELYNSSGVKVAETEDVVGQLPAISGAGDNGKVVGVSSGNYGLVTAASADLSYVTVNEEATLPNSKRLIDGDLDVVVSGANLSVNYPDSSGDNLVTGVLLKNSKEAKQVNANATGALSIDYSQGSVYDMTQTGNITSFAVTNVPSNGACVLTIIRRKSNTTAYSITWGASVKWDGGVAPALGVVTTKVEVITLMTVDGGTTWFGGYMQAVA